MKHRKIQKIVVVVVALAAIGLCITRLSYLTRLERNEEIYVKLSEVVVETSDNSAVIITEVGEEDSSPASVTQEKAEVVVEENTFVLQQSSFEILQETNQDIYAWITIADTNVNYPILQNAEDNYYLKRCIDGKRGLPGCIYTNSCSAKDFSSWNTVIYGHNMMNGTMFGGLKIADDWEEKQEYIDIKSSGGENKYRVYAVTEFSDAYLPIAYDENRDAAREQFLQDVKAAAMEAGYLRNDMDVTIEDKLVTLSTCIKGKDDKRLLIVGVLEK